MAKRARVKDADEEEPKKQAKVSKGAVKHKVDAGDIDNTGSNPAPTNTKEKSKVRIILPAKGKSSDNGSHATRSATVTVPPKTQGPDLVTARVDLSLKFKEHLLPLEPIVLKNLDSALAQNAEVHVEFKCTKSQTPKTKTEVGRPKAPVITNGKSDVNTVKYPLKKIPMVIVPKLPVDKSTVIKGEKKGPSKPDTAPVTSSKGRSSQHTTPQVKPKGISKTVAVSKVPVRRSPRFNRKGLEGMTDKGRTKPKDSPAKSAKADKDDEVEDDTSQTEAPEQDDDDEAAEADGGVDDTENTEQDKGDEEEHDSLNEVEDTGRKQQSSKGSLADHLAKTIKKNKLKRKIKEQVKAAQAVMDNHAKKKKGNRGKKYGTPRPMPP